MLYKQSHHVLLKYDKVIPIAHHRKYFGRRQQYPCTQHTFNSHKFYLNLVHIFPTKITQKFSGIQLSEVGYLPAIIDKYVITRIKEWLVMLVHLILLVVVTDDIASYL